MPSRAVKNIGVIGTLAANVLALIGIYVLTSTEIRANATRIARLESARQEATSTTERHERRLDDQQQKLDHIVAQFDRILAALDRIEHQQTVARAGEFPGD